MRRAASTGTCSDVQVAIRVRPLNDLEKSTPGCVESVEIGDNFVVMRQNEAESTFAFDSVFGPGASTHDLYEKLAHPIVSSCLLGINGTIFAYGQTASGKTFTMQGHEREPGILRLAARHLFQGSEKFAVTATVSYIEIYNERIKDLLSSVSGKLAQEAANDLKIREDPQKGFFVDGVMEAPVSSYEQMMDRFQEGERRRHVAGTDMNEKSSRSHTVFTLNLLIKPTSKNSDPEFMGGALKSRLCLVDLAGSENVRNTNAEGDRLKEGGQINKSLLTLSMVISSLAKGKDVAGQHVKFRDSKLTQILQPSLVGNCRTAVVCCITPASMFSQETLSTLKFANSAKNIKTEFVVNQMVDQSRSIKSYQEQIEAYQATLQKERLEADELRQRNLLLESRLEKVNQDAEAKVQAVKDRLETEKSNAEERMSELNSQYQTKLNDLKESLHSQLEQNQLNTTLLSEREKELERLSGALQETESERDSYQNALAEQLARIELQAKELDAMFDEKAGLEQTLESVKQQNSELGERLVVCEKEKQAQIEQLRKEQEKLSAEYETKLGKANASVSSLNSALQEELSKSKDLESKIASLESDLVSCRLESQQRLNQVQESETVLTNLESKLAACEQRASDFDSQLKAKTKLADNLSAELANLKQEHQTVVLSLEKEQAKAKDLTKLLSEREEENENLQATVKDRDSTIQTHLESLHSAQQQIQDQQRIIEEKDEELENLCNQLDAAEAKVSEKSNALDEAEMEIANLKEQRGDVQATLAKKEAELKLTQKELDSVQKLLSGDLDKLRAENVSLEKTKRELESSVEKLGDEKSTLESQLATSNSRIESLESELASVTSKLKEIEYGLANSQEENQQLAQTIKDLKTEKESLAKELKETQRQAKSVERELTNVQKSAKDVSGSLGKEVEELSRENVRLEGELSNVQEIRSDLLSKLDVLKEDYEKQQETIEFFKESIARVQDEFADEADKLRDSNVELEEELNSVWKDQVMPMMERVGELEMHLLESTQTNIELNEVLAAEQARAQQLYGEIEALQIELDSLAVELTSAQMQRQILHAEHDLALEEVDIQQSELKQARDELEALYAQMEGLHQEKDALSSEVNVLVSMNRVQSTESEFAKEQITWFEDMLGDLQETLEQAETEKKDLEARLRESTEKIDQLLSDKNAVETQIEMVAHDKSSLTNQIANLETEKEQMVQSLADANEKIDSLKGELKTHEENTETLRELISRLESENAALQLSETSKETLIVELEEQVESLESTLNELEHELSRLDEDRVELSSSLVNMCETYVCLQEEKLAQAMEKEILQMNVIELESKLRENVVALECVAEELTETKLALEDAQDQLAGAEETLNDIKDECHATKDQVQALESEKKEMLVRLVTLQLQNNILESDKEGAELMLLEEAESLRGQLREAVDQLKESQEMLAEKDDETKTLQDQVARTASELESTQQLLSDIQKKAEQNEAVWANDVAEKQLRIDSLTNELKVCESKLESARGEATGLAIEVEGIQNELDTTINAKNELDYELGQIRTAKSALQSQLSKLEAESVTEIQTLQKSVQDLERQLVDARKLMASADGASVALQKEIERISKDASESRSKCNELQNQLKRKEQELSDINTKLDSLTSEASDLREKIASLEVEVDAKESSLKQLSMNESQVCAKVRELEAQLKASESEFRRQLSDVEADRNNVKAALENKLCDLEATREKLLVDCEKAESMKAELEKTLKEVHVVLEEEKQRAENAIQEKDEQLLKMKKQLESLENELRVVSSANAQEFDQAKALADSRFAEIERLKNDLANAESRSKEASARLEKLLADSNKEKDEMLAMHEQELERLREELRGHERGARELVESQQVERDQALARVNLTLINTQARLAAAISESGQHRDELAKAKMEIAKLTKQTEQLARDLTKEKDQSKGNQNSAETLVQAQANIDQLQSTIQDMTTQLEALRKRNEKLEQNKLTHKELAEINNLKEECAVLRSENSKLKPPSEESLLEFERRMTEAIKAKEEAIDRLKRFTESAAEKQAALEEEKKRQVRELERENLSLYKRLKELGALDRKKENAHSNVSRVHN